MKDNGIIWLASYPRSGNTWIRLLLAQVLKDEQTPVDLNALPFANITRSRELVDDILGFESADLSEQKLEHLWPEVCHHIAATHSAPLFIKSHARYPVELSQRDELAQASAGVVLIVRHPADVAVSLSHFFDLSLDRAIEIMADPSFCYNHPPGGILESLPEWTGSWSTHLRSWLKSGLQLHLVKYEDLSADPEATLRGILAFAGLPASSSALKRATQQTALANLQMIESLTGFREAPTHQRAFFRSGAVGHTPSLLTAAQVHALTLIHGETMKFANYN